MTWATGFKTLSAPDKLEIILAKRAPAKLFKAEGT
jgi:hypothetical protein